MKPSLYFGSNNVASRVLQAHQAQNFSELIDALSSCPQLGITREEFQASDRKQQGAIKRQLPYLTACTFPASPWEGGRTKANARACNLIFLDVDDHQEAEKLLQSITTSRVALSPFNFAIYKTASFTAGKPRLRIMVEAQGISPEKYPQAVQTIAAHFGCPRIDECSETCCQAMYVPCIFQGEDPDLEYAFIHHNRKGRAFTVADIEAGHSIASDAPAARQQSDSESDGLEYLRTPLSGYSPEIVREMLSKLDADLPRREWVKVAAALKHQFSLDPEQGYELFERWSATAKSKYVESGPGSPQELWDSLEANPTDKVPGTLWTLIQIAQTAGWVNPLKTANSQVNVVEQDGLLLKLDQRRLLLSAPPEKPVSVYSLQGQQVCTPGNITVISAQAKSGKTAVMGAVLASVLGASRPLRNEDVDAPDGCGDYFGFASVEHEGKAVLYFDTEQAPYDAWTLLKRAACRAACESWPDNFRFYSLADVSTQDRRKMVALELARASRQCDGVHSAFIDGVGDLCHDPNDTIESFNLVEQLQRLAIEHHCPIITVLHENPSGGETGKTRGHLGSQLERKAESNLRVFKDAQSICTIYSERCRRASIPKDQGPRFIFDAEAGMHLTYHGDRLAERAEAKRGKHRHLVDRVFEHSSEGGLPFNELKARILAADTSLRDRTARRRIKTWEELQLVQVTHDGDYLKVSGFGQSGQTPVN